MSSLDLGMRLLVDNIPQQRKPGGRAIRKRTVNIFIDPLAGEGNYRVRVTGSAIPDDGAGALVGDITWDRAYLYRIVQRLRDEWNRSIINFQEDDDVATRSFPFSDSYDLAEHAKSESLSHSLRRLAREGYRLYQSLFLTGDAQLRELGEILTAALRDAEQVIAVHSDELFIPWNMLYIPPRDGEDLEDDDAPWEYDGFLGYRHRIEHNPKRMPGWAPYLEVQGAIRAGLNVDRALDRMRVPVVTPLEEMISRYTSDVTIRTRRSDLARALQSPDFKDQIMYFGCHGHAATETEHAHILLTDREKIFTDDFDRWLSNHGFAHSPVVFVNACQGGQMTSMFYTSFGRAMLRHGANCLVGPQIDIPADFAREYSLRFFSKILSGVAVGDAVTDLARSFAGEYSNPLGLVMSLYKGMDTRFAVRPEQAANAH